MTSLARVTISMKAIIDEHQANGGSAPKVLEEWIEPSLSQFVERLFMRGLDIRCMTHELTQRGTKQTLDFWSSLSQHFLAHTGLEFRQRNDSHQTGHWFGQNGMESKLTFR